MNNDNTINTILFPYATFNHLISALLYFESSLPKTVTLKEESTYITIHQTNNINDNIRTRCPYRSHLFILLLHLGPSSSSFIFLNIPTSLLPSENL